MSDHHEVPAESGVWLPFDAALGTTIPAMPGVLLLHDAPQRDRRGSFRKPYTINSLKGSPPAEIFFSSSSAGVVRGMHTSAPGHLSGKIVTVVSGKVMDVLLDLRPGRDFGKTVSLQLDPNSPSILVPSGVAHGFQALSDDTTLLYCVQNRYIPELERGVHPLSIGIKWPLPVSEISARDSRLPDITLVGRADG